jgi:MSHA biogenesis protein MshQ
VKNTDDACTTIPIRTRTPASLSSATTADSVNTSGLLVAGDAGLKFSKPSVAGYVDFFVTTPAWLQFPWQGGAVNTNPTGRATFGVYKSRLIYMRENY